MAERTCQLTGKTFQVSDLEQRLAAELAVSLGAIEPSERLRRMLSFKSGKRLFQRNCDATAKRLFSVYPSSSAFPVFAPSYYFSSDWDPLAYGQAFDFKRLFAEQLLELWVKIPRPAFYHLSAESTRVSHVVRNVRNCYLVFDGNCCSGCLCCVEVTGSHNCLDGYGLNRCSDCYDCVQCEDCSALRFADFSDNCHDSWFLYNCQDCRHCLFCVNVTGKEYCIRNEQVTPERFREVIQTLALDARPTLELARNDFLEFLRSQTSPHILARECENVTGNYLRRTISAEDCYECFDCSEVSIGFSLQGCKHCLECISCSGLSFSARSINCHNGQRLLNCIDCVDSLSDSAYCADCARSSHLFGCVGLRDREYCIFNTQYSRDEYLSQLQHIRKHLIDRNVWGNFLAPALSGYSYNHSAAMEFMPLTRIPCQMMGFRWDDSDQGLTPGDLISSARSTSGEFFADIPITAGELATEGVSDRVFVCELSGRPFQLTAEEIAVHIRLGVAPPAVCFDERHLLRLRRLATLQLYERKCSLSGKAIRSAFGPKWRQPVADATTWNHSSG